METLAPEVTNQYPTRRGSVDTWITACRPRLPLPLQVHPDTAAPYPGRRKKEHTLQAFFAPLWSWRTAPTGLSC
jgi:hypothetical protein